MEAAESKDPVNSVQNAAPNTGTDTEPRLVLTASSEEDGALTLPMF